jgi:hypothetical protein
MVDAHGRDVAHTDEFRCLGPAMSRNNSVVTISEDRTDKSEFFACPVAWGVACKPLISPADWAPISQPVSGIDEIPSNFPVIRNSQGETRSNLTAS